MSLLNEDARKFVSEHVGAFLIAGAAVIVPLLSGYAYLVSKLDSLNSERVSFERERAAAQVAIARDKLEVEKLQAQLTIATESSKQLLQEVVTRQQQTTSERNQLNEAWRNIELWRQKLNPEQEYKTLVDEYTALAVDINHCAPRGELEKYQRARILAERILYAAAQTNNGAHLQFARRIQPISYQAYECKNSTP